MAFVVWHFNPDAVADGFIPRKSLGSFIQRSLAQINTVGIFFVSLISAQQRFSRRVLKLNVASSTACLHKYHLYSFEVKQRLFFFF